MHVSGLGLTVHDSQVHVIPKKNKKKNIFLVYFTNFIIFIILDH